MANPNADEKYSAAETKRRADAALTKMLALPPKPHAKGKTQGESQARQSTDTAPRGR